MSTARVLLVDDDQTTLVAVGRLLQRHQYEVTRCAGTAEGVSLALRSAWDVVVLDLALEAPGAVQIQGFDGLTLLRWLRRVGRSVPVILLTASEAAGLEAQARSDGAFGVVRKSDPPQRLVEMVQAALEAPKSMPSASTQTGWVERAQRPGFMGGLRAAAQHRLRAVMNLFC